MYNLRNLKLGLGLCCTMTVCGCGQGTICICCLRARVSSEVWQEKAYLANHTTLVNLLSYLKQYLHCYISITKYQGVS